MINQLFGSLADVFPGLIFVTIVAGLLVLGRTWNRMSAGSAGAGRALIEAPAQMGLQKVPWDLLGVEAGISSGSTAPIEVLLRRAEAMGITPDVNDALGVDLRYDDVLNQIEAALGLPPLPLAPPSAPYHPPEGTP